MTCRIDGAPVACEGRDRAERASGRRHHVLTISVRNGSEQTATTGQTWGRPDLGPATPSYMVNFWKTATPDALRWSERSRGEYLGLYPYYTLGGFADRNWTFEVDARVRRRPTDPPRRWRGRQSRRRGRRRT